jgi:glycogen synthase
MTKKIKTVVFDLGGYDESKPNNNILETVNYSDDELAALQAEEAKAEAKAALLEKLGISEDEAKLLLG